jgi:zinc protease
VTAPAKPKAARPAPTAPREYHFPRFERRRLDNGIQLVVAHVDKLPLVTISALFDAGSVCDTRGREGLAYLTTKLLLEGTKRSDGGELIERFEQLGASVEAHGDWDSAAVTVSALTDNIAPAFALFAEVLRTPAFREREIERLRGERLAELLQQRAEPRGLADDMFSRVLYEAGSRYGVPDAGDETSIAAIQRADIQAFYEARYRPGDLTLIVAGDVTADDAQALASKALGDWTGARAEPTTVSDRPRSTSRGVHVIAKPDAQQSELRIGHVGVPRKHPDYFSTVVMNAVLGGLFNSRINMNLREAHGYTYGASSGFDWRRQAGPFVVSTAVRSDVTDASAREVLGEIDRIRAAPIEEEELSLATSYLGGVFPIRYETTAAIAAALATLVVHDLPADYYDQYRANVRGVTIESVHAAAKQYLKPEELQLLVVGDPATVKEPLTALQFGALSVYDTQGRPVEL